ncbi:polysaccharide biosynthesis/export family protein [Massilia sp. TS11]|uniref:polysaccharide biosynthesis/export family protein n=1 Tax=Massilia sp. TS11 TaxID=2908003 RepID=UPI001EDC4427|nr:polysaccharide biosynthesis/export family protein [Massilia sp. TS11]MCG2584312.1 polysaccharide biosynthesis/export family protein [Massilia sp. TS11]
MARLFVVAVSALFLLTACSMRLPMGAGQQTMEEPVPINTSLVARQRAAYQHPGALPPNLTAAAQAPYTLGPGDILAIAVWDHPELLPPNSQDLPVTAQAAGISTPAPGFAIDGEGRLQFPYAGSVPAAGLTVEQLRQELGQRLSRVLREPRITVRVQAYRSKRVYVDGQVRQPGLQTLDDVPMTVQEAVQRAGGLLPEADASRVSLERGTQRYPLDLVRQTAAGRLLLLPNDVLHVPPREDNRVFVAGEVLAPRALNMRAGRLTLNEALGEVGGINPQTGDASQVYVVRQEGGKARVYRLDARAAEALALAEQFELEARDVVYVAASPLANWHRAISLVFPGALSAAVSAAKP